METIDLGNGRDVPVASGVGKNDLILAYNEATHKLQYIKMEALNNSGYACRRWNTRMSTPRGEAVGNLEYLSNLPGMLGLGGYLVQKNHSRRKLSPTDHRKFATGEPAALDGSMGDYMWGWGTPFYYAFWVDGDYYYEAISLKPIPGRENYKIPVASTSALGVSVMDRTTNELVSVVSDDPRYRGGNNDASLDSKFNTQLGRAASSMTAEAFGTAARKKGAGFEAYWYTFPAIIGILTRVIMGTRNIQEAVNPSKDSNGLYQGGCGAGVSNAGAWWNEQYKYYPFIPTSVGVEKGDFTGEIPYDVQGPSGKLQTVNIPCFFGLKNFFGCMYRLERGALINKVAGGAGDYYVVEKMSTSYSMSSLSGLKKVGQVPATANKGWEYIKVLSMQNLAHFPTQTGATSSTDYSDGFYNDNASSGLRVPSRGGHAGYGSDAGVEYLYASSGVTHSSAYYGSPLCEVDGDWDTNPIIVSA